MMNYAGLRAEQARLRERGIHRGIGFAAFIEVTNPSAAFYGVGGAKISAQDGATVRLDADRRDRSARRGVTEQGQGAEAVIAQVVASAFGVPIERVRVITGDTDNTPYGGGTWASRAAGIGGEAAWQAGKALRANVLAVAASILQAKPDALDIRNGASSIAPAAPSAWPRRAGAHRLFPPRHAAARLPGRADGDAPLRAARLAVRLHQRHPGEPRRGRHRDRRVTLLKHWCVEDCGTVINPQLVDEQIRGGIVQGIGAALFEHCLYDARGQLLNGNMADYLVPMAAEMPDIEVGHVVTPTADSELGAKGAGEAGTAGAPAR